MNTSELRALAPVLWRTLRDIANEVDRLQDENKHLQTRETLYDEVIDGLASREREKLQQQMAVLRAENVRLRALVTSLGGDPGPPPQKLLQ